jgi:hypothetical protein
MPDLALQLISALLSTIAVLYGTYWLFRFLRFIRNSRAMLPGDKLASSFKIDSPQERVNLKVRQTRDPGFLSIPKYPRAVPLDSKLEYEAEIHVPGRDGRYICQGFWTADPFATVVAFYQREFPNWKKDSEFMAGRPGGYRCREHSPGCVRTVEIRSQPQREQRRLPGASESSRTIINYSVLYSTNIGPV